MGFGTYEVNTPQVIYNALSVGYRHLDLAENYKNFDGFRFHVAVADGCSRWCWADVRFPFGGSHEEATGGGCQHCTTVKDCIGIV